MTAPGGPGRLAAIATTAKVVAAAVPRARRGVQNSRKASEFVPSRKASELPAIPKHIAAAAEFIQPTAEELRAKERARVAELDATTLILEAARQRRYAALKLKTDGGVVLQAVPQKGNGRPPEHAAPEHKANREILVEAAGDAVRYAAP